MIWFWGKKRPQKTANEALSLFQKGQSDEAFALLEKAEEKLGAQPWFHFAESLYEQEHAEASRKALDQLLKLDDKHWDGLVLLAEWEECYGDSAKAIEVHRKLHTMSPKHAGVLKTLLAFLEEAQEWEEIVSLLPEETDDPDLLLWRAVGYCQLERYEEGLELLESLLRFYENRIKHAMSEDEFEEIRNTMQEIQLLHDDVYVNVHDQTSLILHYAKRGNLDVSSGNNYILMGQSLMPHAEHSPASVVLQTPQHMVDWADTVLVDEADDPLALTQKGLASMRWLAFDDALSFLQNACDSENPHFAAYLAYGSILSCQKHRWLDALYCLPETSSTPMPTEQLTSVVTDLGVFTPEETRVVHASVFPLRGSLSILSQEEVTIRVLPVDVRATDLPEYEELLQQFSEDRRAYEASTGLATPKVAMAKVEDLMNVSGEHGWTFAHEFAHLAYFHLPEPWREVIHSLFADALEAHYSFGSYQLSNDDEFFAGAYVDYLLWKYDIEEPLMDEHGIRADIYAVFDAIAAHDNFESESFLNEAAEWLDSSDE